MRWPPIPKYSAVSEAGVAGGGVACGGDACGGSSVSIVGVACDGDACGGGSRDDAAAVLEYQSVSGDGGATRDIGCSRYAQLSSVRATECDTDAADIDLAEPMSPPEMRVQSSDVAVPTLLGRTQSEATLELVLSW